VIAERTKLLCLNPSCPTTWLAFISTRISIISASQLAVLVQRIVSIEPYSADLCAETALKLIDYSDREIAKFLLTKAIVLDPAKLGCSLDLGFILEIKKEFETAIRLYTRESILSPRNPLPHFNKGNVAMASGDPQTSALNYDRSIALGADSTGVLKSAAIAHLISGNFTRGWSLYESRFLKGSGNMVNDVLTLRSSKPLLRGPLSIYKTATVLVWPEQGVGDEIMFGSMLKELYHVVGRLLVQLDRRLILLFSRMLPDVTFFERDSLVPEDLYDFHVAIGSLGQYFRPSIESFERGKKRYLKSDPYRTKELRRSLFVNGNETLVGLSWRSANADTGAQRSVPLSTLAQNLASERVRLISLQYGDIAHDIEAAKYDVGIDVVVPSIVDPTNDLDGLAALIEACDEVVSIGNATAHLAGALGKKTTVLVPRIGTRTTDGGVMPGWRWLGNSGKCLWYESAELYRQQENEKDWIGVLSRLSTDRSHREKR